MRRTIFFGALAVGVLVFVVAVVSFAAVRNQLQREAQDELYRQAAVTAALIEAEIDELAPSGAGGLLRRAAEARTRIALVLARAREIGGHDIVEAALQVGERTVPLVPDPQLLAEIPGTASGRDVVAVAVAGAPMNATVRRIPFGDSGAELVVAIGRSQPLLPLQAFTRGLLVALAVGGLLVVALAGWFARSTGRRLAGLEEASAAIAAGDLAARAPVTGDDEITKASRAFNAMAGQLEAARKREREFLLSVGHDLRTPLTTIRGYAEALDEGDVADHDMDRVAAVLHQQTDRLSRLVEDFMLLARLQAREFTLRPEPVDLTAHVKQLAEAHRLRYDAVHVRMDVAVDPVGVVEIDPDRVSQILGNLVDNAIRYTPEGGTVELRLEREDRGIVLTVTDSGPGIAHEDLPHVFDRFYVADRYRPVRPEGSGLGLSIVRELVDAMAGTIEVESELGSGTVVRVVLPVRDSP